MVNNEENVKATNCGSFVEAVIFLAQRVIQEAFQCRSIIIFNMKKYKWIYVEAFNTIIKHMLLFHKTSANYNYIFGIVSSGVTNNL